MKHIMIDTDVNAAFKKNDDENVNTFKAIGCTGINVVVLDELLSFMAVAER